MQLEIIGVYWVGKQTSENMFPFTGVINLGDDGRFEGEMEDFLGRSQVNGEIKDYMVTFHKVYKGEHEKIFYLLSNRSPGKTNSMFGGWKGVYRSSLGSGQAACSIHPKL